MMTAPESEDAILSAALTWPKEALPYAAAEIRPDHFFGPNETLWRAVLGVFCAGGSVDFASVVNALRDVGALDAIGGVARISMLCTLGGVPATLPENIRRVKEASARRRMIKMMESELEALRTPGIEVGGVISRSMTALETIGNDRATAKAPTIKELVMQVVTKVQARQNGEQSESGISTGLRSLDRFTGGLRSGAQWVIAGPAKGGKSSLALSFLNSISINSNRRSAFIGLEMPSVENVERLMCAVGNVSSGVMISGKLTDGDSAKIVVAAGRVGGAPLLFRDDIFDLAEMVATIRQMKAAYPDLFAVFVDYAQLIAGDQLDRNGREREVAMVSRSLRKAGMQLSLCMVLLSQVNDDGKLRESRALGMDATKIVFIEFDDQPGVRKLRLVQRDGQSGVELKVAYRGDYFQFADLADEDAATQERLPI